MGLRNILRWIVPGDRRASLSEDLRSKLATKTFAAIQTDVQRLLVADPSAPEFELFLAEARRLEWPVLQLEKLKAFGHYYRGELDKAFARATPYCGGLYGPEFDPDLFIIAVLCVFNNNQFEDAHRMLASAGDNERLLADRVDYHNIKGSICLASNRLAEAKISMDAARRMDPDDALTAMNAYALYFELGEMPAFERLRAEIAGGRWSDGSAFALATPELALDNYREGFRLLERRYGQGDASRYVNPALPAQSRWQGRAVDYPVGRNLLVTCEQGLGDTVMMSRYLPRLMELTAGRLTVETQPEAFPLLRHNFPDIAVVLREHGRRPTQQFDLWIGSMSLPYVFDSVPGNIPGTAGYIAVPPESLAYWRERVIARSSGGRPRIGVGWSGSPSHRNDRRRSIPFEIFARLLRQLPDIDFFALQTKVPDVRPANLVSVTEEMITLADTAALIAEMDLVISVDTSVVHVAGALGKPTWLLLPKRYEWRWSLEGERNYWYDAVRVLRQETHGDWEGLLAETFGRRLGNFFGERIAP